MKKIFMFFAAVAMTAGIASAQDINSVTETYNNGAMELEMGNKEAALGYFQAALTAAEELGEEGMQIADNCKNTIPVLMNSIAKDYIKAEQFDAALEQLNKTIEAAGLYGNAEVAEDAKALINQTLMAKGNDMINNKDFAGAIEVYNQIMAAEPANAMAALRLGMAYGAAGNIEEAEKAYLVAAENGQDKNAYKQLSNLFVKKAAAVLKTKNYAQAVEFALKSNEYLENATAMKVAGTAASALQKNAEAIQYLEKYLELSPNAKDAAQMKYTIAATAQVMGDNAKAKEYYTMILSDPKFGPTAKQMLETIK
ncbi:MAG: tetratricopeptide repeat protein [Bacteroidales bacterium]|jgi:tetratricopeptide (TPR) repeat protein|nr:tetratricopeptide repeat protein [Bacteroidales bacterium]